jgi:hypothetical protein
MKRRYPWKLSGPWYRRETTGGPAGSGGRPIIQKYAAADFVNMFLLEPQRSLKYVCEDFVNRICLGSVYEPVSPTTRQNGDSLKFFLDSHSRFYLVVCELHCQAPGCPSVSRDQVCEAGFVVRRYRSHSNAAGRVALSQIMVERNHIMAKIGKILPKQQSTNGQGAVEFTRNPLKWLQGASENARSKKLQSLQAEYTANTRELQKKTLIHKTELILQKWVVNHDLKGTGAWKEVGDETPHEIDEEIYPLYPLISDPTEDNHSAKGKTIYFGVVPTFSADLDEKGNAKFDNESAHEIRCFVRHHKEGCPVKSSRADCHGEIVWSEATESYKLAAFLDLDGSGHKPINIQLPDINALKDQALRGPAGKGVNVRMNPPPDSALNSVKKNNDMSMGGKDDWTKSRGGQVCFFCIPLITIVALFVLRIFLPIVVFFFGLWFLLKQVAADLKAYGPEFMAKIEAEIVAKGSVTIGAEVYSDVNDMKDKLPKKVKEMINADETLPNYLKNEFNGQVDTDFDTTMDIIIGMATDFSDDPEVPGIAGKMPQATDGLIYFSKVNPT